MRSTHLAIALLAVTFTQPILADHGVRGNPVAVPIRQGAARPQADGPKIDTNGSPDLNCLNAGGRPERDAKGEITGCGCRNDSQITMASLRARSFASCPGNVPVLSACTGVAGESRYAEGKDGYGVCECYDF